MRAGRSVPAGIAAGYRKGLTAIIDANVVTILVAFILFILATAGVKGFAFTLGVGTIVSLFTAVVLRRRRSSARWAGSRMLRPAVRARRRRSRRATSRSTSWARRGGSSRCRA